MKTEMKWCIEQFVKKICSPIICKTEKGDVFFMNGEECAAFQFDKKYEVCLNNDKRLNISRNYANEVQNKIMDYIKIGDLNV